MRKFLMIFLWGCFVLSIKVEAQKRERIGMEAWKKAVVNVETVSYQHSQDYINFIVDSLRKANYPHSIDSIKSILERSIFIFTGTAIYIKDHNRKYLVSVLHVFIDDTLTNAKENRIDRRLAHYEVPTGIVNQISIRTPFQYFIDNGRQAYNNNGLITNSFKDGPMPYWFVQDSSGDGIGILSLQPDSCKFLVEMLQRNGYEPLSLADIMPDRKDGEINELDSIVTIGYPENISVVKVKGPNYSIISQMFYQRPELVISFTVEGKIAQYHPSIQHYFVNITAYPGNSGGPIISRNGRLLGLISGGNANSVYDDHANVMKNMHGVGQLIEVINTKCLPDELKKFKPHEDKYLQAEARNTTSPTQKQAIYSSSVTPPQMPLH